MRYIIALVLPGCFLMPSSVTPGSDHGLKGGETLYVSEDSLALEIMGGSLNKEDHRPRSRGRPMNVIATGAEVRVTSDYEQQRTNITNGASLAHRNPWILVEVVDSPVAAQRGWKGWIHVDTTKRQPVELPALANAELVRASLLCPHADSNDVACNVNLPANSPIRVVGCVGPRVHVELFTDRGLYINGFVNATQIPNAPCTTALKE